MLANVETGPERLRRVVALHFDPRGGSAYWLERAAERGLDPRKDVRSLSDIALLGEMSAAELRDRPLWDYVPRALHARFDRFILTSSADGQGARTWSAFRADEFDEAFVLPFAAAAAHVGFPTAASWLYVGPGGSHIGGKLARHLANALGGADPFCIDYDPRPAQGLSDDPTGPRRYAHRVVDEAVEIIRNQPVEVLFSSLEMLRELGLALGNEHARRIRGVHYCGRGLAAGALAEVQQAIYPQAVHLGSHTHALFGACVEFCTAPNRRPCFFPFGNRLFIETIDRAGGAVPPGQPGRLRFTRLDESMLIVRCPVADTAALVALPAGAPEGYSSCGIQSCADRSADLERAEARPGSTALT